MWCLFAATHLVSRGRYSIVHVRHWVYDEEKISYSTVASPCNSIGCSSQERSSSDNGKG